MPSSPRWVSFCGVPRFASTQADCSQFHLSGGEAAAPAAEGAAEGAAKAAPLSPEGFLAEVSRPHENSGGAGLPRSIVLIILVSLQAQSFVSHPQLYT